MLYYLCFTPSTAIGPTVCDRECDWEALSRPISHPRTCRSPPPRSKPLGAIVPETLLKTNAKQKRDRDRDSQPRPHPRLNSQPQEGTKGYFHACFNFEAKNSLKRREGQPDPHQSKKSMFMMFMCLCLLLQSKVTTYWTSLVKVKMHGHTSDFNGYVSALCFAVGSILLCALGHVKALSKRQNRWWDLRSGKKGLQEGGKAHQNRAPSSGNDKRPRKSRFKKL